MDDRRGPLEREGEAEERIAGGAEDLAMRSYFRLTGPTNIGLKGEGKNAASSYL